MSDLWAGIGDVFQDAVAIMYDSEATIKRAGARTSNGRFGYTTEMDTVATKVPCTVQHNVPNRSASYMDRLAGRVLCLMVMPRTYDVLDADVIYIAGGDTYEVVGSPHIDGPDDPALNVPCAAAAPVATNT